MTDLLLTGCPSFLAVAVARQHRALHPRGRIRLGWMTGDATAYGATLSAMAGAEVLPPGCDREAWLTALAGPAVQQVVLFLLPEQHESGSDRSTSASWRCVYAAATLLDALVHRQRSRRSGSVHLRAVFNSGLLAPVADRISEASPFAGDSLEGSASASLALLVDRTRASGAVRGGSVVLADLFGPHQPSHLGVAHVIEAVLDGRRVPIYGETGGLVRPLLAADAARAVCGLLEDDALARAGLSGAQQLSQLALAMTICRAVDRCAARLPEFAGLVPASPAARGQPSASLLSFVQDRRERPRLWPVDFSRTRAALGQLVLSPIERALEDTVAWHINARRPADAAAA